MRIRLPVCVRQLTILDCSALDWLLLGDDGSIEDADELLKALDVADVPAGRSHWGVTILQAMEEYDAGPVWAFDQFPIDIDQPGMNKSTLYRGSLTRAAVSATRAAISRIQDAAIDKCDDLWIHQRSPRSDHDPLSNLKVYSPCLHAKSEYGRLSVGESMPFLGGRLHHRPLLKAAQRDFDVNRHTAQHISRRIWCADSQPGALSRLFGPSLYVYGGHIEDNALERQGLTLMLGATAVLGVRGEAVCVATYDGRGIWISHIRRPKAKHDNALWPKVPAASGLIELGVLTEAQCRRLYWPCFTGWSRSFTKTLQEVWVDFHTDQHMNNTAYLYFDFYNGAMSTSQCSHLIEAMDYILSHVARGNQVNAAVLMGGSYFSNGIALNVIEAASDPSTESWLNINRIDDVVYYLLHEFPARGILTVAAIRGNAAAGGVALATACDIVIAGHEVVLNPSYRAVGLFGSEYHTLSYYGRCGEQNAKALLRSMTPLSPSQAQQVGLVDYVFPGTGDILDDYIRTHVSFLLQPRVLKRGFWKSRVDLSPAALARARALELCEMSKDFWSARSVRYHSRRFDFVRKVKTLRTPLRYARHRRSLDATLFDEEERDEFDDAKYFSLLAEKKALHLLRQQVRTEMEALKAKENELPVSRRPSIITLVEEKNLSSMVSPETGWKVETMFSCYYKPIEEVLGPIDERFTPPASPRSIEMATFQS